MNTHPEQHLGVRMLVQQRHENKEWGAGMYDTLVLRNSQCVRKPVVRL